MTLNVLFRQGKQRITQSIGRWGLIPLLSLLVVAPPVVHESRASEAIDTAPASFPLPTGEPVLVIDGAIKQKNVGNEAHLDIEMLNALPAHTLHTSTVVTDGVKKFDGYLMRDVLSLVGVQGHTIEAKALNNYSVEIPLADFHDYDVLLATHMDGERLLPSGKGPFWIVYPRDKWRPLQDIRYDYRWVWQLNRLTIK